MNYQIDQKIIDQLPQIMLDGLLEDENRYINDWIKYTLQYAKNYNNSQEVGIVLDKTNWEHFDTVLGEERAVRFHTANMRKWLDEGNDNLILIHNHPNNGIFSDKDIFNFCKCLAVHALIVVGNRGTIYLLQKRKNFNKLKLIQCYSDAIDREYGKYTRSEILENVLRRYHDALNIKFVKEEIVC